MESSDRDRNRDERNLALNERLLSEIEKNPIDLMAIESLLKEEGLQSCSAANSEKLLSKLFPYEGFPYPSPAPAKQVKILSIFKVWLIKRGNYNNYEETLINALVSNLITCNPGDEAVRFEIFKGLVNEDGLNVRAKVNSGDSTNYIPILQKALNGAGYFLAEGFQFKFNLKLLDFLLEKGAGRDLVPTINRVEALAVYNAVRHSHVPELFAIWDIVKEAKPELQKTDFTNISKEQATEIEIIGEKIAKLYLYCKEEGITADEINNNKDWVLTFSPLDLKYLAAIKANSQCVSEGIKELTNNFVLEDKVTTFLKAEVNSPVDVELALSTKSL